MKDYYFAELLSVYGNLLTDKQKEMTAYFYNCDLSFGEIADIKGISRQTVSDTISKAKNILTKFEKELNLLKKREKLIALAKEFCDEELKNKILEILE